MSSYWASHLQDMTPPWMIDRWCVISTDQSMSPAGSARTNHLKSGMHTSGSPVPLSPMMQRCFTQLEQTRIANSAQTSNLSGSSSSGSSLSTQSNAAAKHASTFRNEGLLAKPPRKVQSHLAHPGLRNEDASAPAATTHSDQPSAPDGAMAGALASHDTAIAAAGSAAGKVCPPRTSPTPPLEHHWKRTGRRM